MSTVREDARPQRLAQMSPLQLAFAAQQMRARVALLNADPIAIVGMGCRVPGGGNDPQTLWALLRDGVDAITETPPDRWDTHVYYDADPMAPGKIGTRYGGFIDGLREFDAAFFGISPREALSLDPQQRLFLEVAWESLENAAIAPDSLAESPTGVFLGLCSNDYGQMLVARPATDIDAYMGTGMAASVAAGRLSYLLGLRGPSLAIDTACSSSLVAVHLACQSLRYGECDLALAGGVSRIITPQLSINFSKARMLAPDGRCKTFDAAANGFGRAEGCGVVVLKRLAAAIATGDRVLAVIRGSAVNQDGHTSGLTVPNGPSQQAVVRQALANAGVEAEQIAYVEAHGTGTPLGDPLEIGALSAVFGASHSTARPLLVGSLKTNVGHMEAAAGIGGLLKVVLALQHQAIPPHLHLRHPTPEIDWDRVPIEVPTSRRPWPAGEGRRLAGVSSFGFSGTNAHVILEEAPVQEMPGALTTRPVHILTLSAKTPEALTALSAKYAAALRDRPDMRAEDTGFTANLGRNHFAHRLAVVAASTVDMAEHLAGYAHGSTAAAVAHGSLTSSSPPRIAFLFTGQGAQYPGMGRELYDSAPVFRAAIDRCTAILRGRLPMPLTDVLYPPPGASSPLAETLYTQPALFALQYALAELWRAWGIQPAAVLGHSIGEFAAACTAGVCSVEDGLALIAARARLMHHLPCGGAMVSFPVGQVAVQQAIGRLDLPLDIAALNGPEVTVVSGDARAMPALGAALHTQGWQGTPLAVSHAFHSRLMEPMCAAFEGVVAQVALSPPRLPFISTVYGKALAAEVTQPSYWSRHVREPVRFTAAMEALCEQGYEVCVEIGPRPVLVGMARAWIPPEAICLLPSLRPGQSDWRQMLAVLGALYVRGVPVDWAAFDRTYDRRKVALPTYPWQRQTYWARFEAPPPVPAAPGTAGRGVTHPLLGARLELAQSRQTHFAAHLSSRAPAWLAEHRVFHHTILPAAAYLEMAVAAGQEQFPHQQIIYEDVLFEQTLPLPETTTQRVQLVLDPGSAMTAQFHLYSAPPANGDAAPSWTQHASGTLRVDSAPLTASAQEPTAQLTTIRQRLTQAVDPAALYQALAAQGLTYGPRFRAVAGLWCNEQEALGLIRCQNALTEADYILHPVALDACFQVLGAVVPQALRQHTLLPVSVARLRCTGRLGTTLWSHVCLRPPTGDQPAALCADFRLYDDTGAPVAEIIGFTTRQVERGALAPADLATMGDWLYDIAWRPQGLQGLPPDYLPAVGDLAQCLAPALAACAQPELAHYGRGLALLEQLSVDFIVKAFGALGWTWHPGRRCTTAEIAEDLRIAPPHHRLLARLLDILAQAGLLVRRDTAWEIVAPGHEREPLSQAGALRADYASLDAELTLLTRCGEHLAQVLDGRCDPLALLFPGGDTSLVNRLYQDSPGARMMNGLMREALRLVITHLPPRRRLRVLEIGAGTGGTTAYLLPELPTERCEYVFTDVSPLFLNQAREKFAAYPCVSYRVLDLETVPAAQGFAEERFDVVVATNVLHATADLRRTMAQVRSLLAPGGLLLVLEGTAPQRWVDLVFGLTEGWWKFTDDALRPDYPLLDASRWQALLRDTGFGESHVLAADRQAASLLADQCLLLARAEGTEAPVTHQEAWLIFADAGGFGQRLAAFLATQGITALCVHAGSGFERTGVGDVRIDPAQPDDYRRLVQLIQRQPVSHIVHCWSLDAPTVDQLTAVDFQAATIKGCASALFLVQACVRDVSMPLPALWFITRGAQATDDHPALPGVVQAPLLGLSKVMALEHPELHCRRIDLDPQLQDNECQIVFDEVRAAGREDQIVLRDDRRLVARLRRRPLPRQPDPLPRLRRDATYLIVGGLGGLGLAVAHWLATRGAGHVLLMNRSGASQRHAQRLAAIAEAGATVHVRQADVTREEHVRAVLGDMQRTLPPLRGVIQAAGTVNDGVVSQLSWASFTAVLAPKVVGTWYLHELTRACELDFFVLFSSSAALFGSPGQGNHAAANQFLDAFAHTRRALGLPAQSLNWGAWSEVGAVARLQEATRLRLQGLRVITPAQGIALLGHAMTCGRPQVGVCPLDWPVFLAQFAHLPLLDDVLQEATPGGTPERPHLWVDELLTRLGQATPEQGRDLLVDYLQTRVATTLGGQLAHRPEPNRNLNELGLDSLMGIELKNCIATELGINLPMVNFIAAPSIAQLADHLLAHVAVARLSHAGVSARTTGDDMEEFTL